MIKTYEEFVTTRGWDKVSPYRSALKFIRLAYLPRLLLNAFIGSAVMTVIQTWRVGFSTAYSLTAFFVWAGTQLILSYAYGVRHEIRDRKGWEEAFRDYKAKGEGDTLDAEYLDA